MKVEEPAKVPRPSIAYVDELADERDNFYNDAYDSQYFDDIHRVHPDDDLKVLIAKLIELRIDALVSDFNLSDAGPKNYTGVEVVEAFLEVRGDFPCFIRTSFDENAMASSTDVNRVYSKNVVTEQAIGRDLFKRISLQIEHYRSQVSEWQVEFDKLIAIPAAERTAQQIERLLELDTSLERRLSADQAIAQSVKRQVLQRDGLFAKQGELIGETEKLIAAMKQALGD